MSRRLDWLIDVEDVSIFLQNHHLPHAQQTDYQPIHKTSPSSEDGHSNQCSCTNDSLHKLISTNFKSDTLALVQPRNHLCFTVISVTLFRESASPIYKSADVAISLMFILSETKILRESQNLLCFNQTSPVDDSSNTTMKNSWTREPFTNLF